MYQEGEGVRENGEEGLNKIPNILSAKVQINKLPDIDKIEITCHPSTLALEVEETKLPKYILDKASVSKDYECAWRMEDIPEAIEAARLAGLANLGGQPQFRGPIGISEPWWLNFDPEERKENENWGNYVDRSASETLSAFNDMCKSTNIERECCENFLFIREAKEKGINPMEHLWFVLYFEETS